jgi:DNA-binding XRE family transcriptional regulator
MHRKRAGLSQAEMAFILGGRRGTKVSRYERFKRLPELPTAFAYQVTFGIPASELFAGVFEQVRRVTVRRVRVLYRRLDTAEPDKLTAQKLAALKKVLEPTPEP